MSVATALETMSYLRSIFLCLSQLSQMFNETYKNVCVIVSKKKIVVHCKKIVACRNQQVG